MKKLNKIFAVILLTSLCAAAQELAFFNYINAIGNGEKTTLEVDGKTIGAPFQEGFVTGGLGFMKENVTAQISNGDWKSKPINIKLNPAASPILISYLGETEVKDEKGEPLQEPRRKIENLLLPSREEASGEKFRVVYCGNKTEVLIQTAKLGESSSSKNPDRGVIKLVKLKPIFVKTISNGTVFGYNNKQIGMYDAELSKNVLVVFYDKVNQGESELGVAYTSDVVFK